MYRLFQTPHSFSVTIFTLVFLLFFILMQINLNGFSSLIICPSTHIHSIPILNEQIHTNPHIWYTYLSISNLHRDTRTPPQVFMKRSFYKTTQVFPRQSEWDVLFIPVLFIWKQKYKTEDYHSLQCEYLDLSCCLSPNRWEGTSRARSLQKKTNGLTTQLNWNLSVSSDPIQLKCV